MVSEYTVIVSKYNHQTGRMFDYELTVNAISGTSAREKVRYMFGEPVEIKSVDYKKEWEKGELK